MTAAESNSSPSAELRLLAPGLDLMLARTQDTASIRVNDLLRILKDSGHSALEAHLQIQAIAPLLSTSELQLPEIIVPEIVAPVVEEAAVVAPAVTTPRVIQVASSMPPVKAFSLADDRIVILPEPREVYVDDKLILPHTKGFDSLLVLAERPYTLNTATQLFETVWGSPSINHTLEHRRVRSALYNLRALFGEELGNPFTGAVRNKQGLGYYAVKSLSKPPKGGLKRRK